MPGIGWRSDDAVRFFPLLLKPAAAAVIAILAATLLLGGRSLAPFIVGEGAGNPAWFAMRSSQLAAEERALRAEVDLLLASFESTQQVETSEHP